MLKRILGLILTIFLPDKAAILIVGDWEPCDKGGEKWAGPLEKLGKVRRVTLTDPLTWEGPSVARERPCGGGRWSGPGCRRVRPLRRENDQEVR